MDNSTILFSSSSIGHSACRMSFKLCDSNRMLSLTFLSSFYLYIFVVVVPLTMSDLAKDTAKKKQTDQEFQGHA